MAGGMNKRGGGIPMARRVAPSPGLPDDCPVRHCWMLDPADDSGVRRPGLLVEWRRAEGGPWLGRVVYAVQLRSGEWATVEEWVPAVLVSAS